MINNPVRHEIPVGTTRPQAFVLEVKATPDGDWAAVDLTGATLAIVFTDMTGATVTLGGTASITDATTGAVQYAPDGAETEQTVQVRWQVTAGGEVEYYPRDNKPDIWRWASP